MNFLAAAGLSAVSKVTGHTYLTFTEANWNAPQIVLVTPVDDGTIEGADLSTITHQIISTAGGKYFAFPSADYPKLSVTVYDDETPGVVVQETDGSTVVVETRYRFYRVRLTSAPSSDVTLTMRTDKQTFLSGAGVQVLDQTGNKSYFEYSLTFTTANGRVGRHQC